MAAKKMSKQTELPFPEPSKAPLLAECGSAGLNRYGGIVQEEWLSELKGSKAATKYIEMMDNEPIIAGTLHVMEMLLRQTPWRVEPADDSPQAKQVAEFIETCLEDIDGGFQGFMGEFLTMLPFGYAWMEKVFKLRRGRDNPLREFRSKHRDGRIGWRKIALRAQETLLEWDYDDDGELLGMKQQTNEGEFYTPRSKALHFRLKKNKDNPEGRSLLRSLYSSYFYKSNLVFSEAVGIERNLAGYPVMQLPLEIMSPDASSAESSIRDLFRDMVQRIKRDENEGLVIPAEVDRDGNPSGYKFSLLSSGGKNPGDVDPIIRRYESRMAIALLSEFMLLGTDKVGSFALSSNKTDLFAVALGTILDIRDEQFNDDAIVELTVLNGWPEEMAPRLVHGDIETPDLAQLAGFVSSMVGAGAIVPDDALETHLREVASLPETDPMTQRSDAGLGDDMGDIALPPDLTVAAPEEEDPVATPDVVEEAVDPATALNGAQIKSLQEILTAVAQGQIPRESGVNMIQAAFPLSLKQADKIMGEIGRGFMPRPEAM